MLSRSVLSAALAVLSGIGAEAHLAVLYPGTRGSTMAKNGTVDETDGLGVVVDQTDAPVYPYGMAFIYPCGGLPVSTNRTLWPLTGPPPPVILQPGHQANHDWGMIFVNIGLGTNPANFNTQMRPEFSFTFPTADEYDAQICLPELNLPQDSVAGKVRAGDNATIQIVETAKHGGALYSCIDITFTDSAYPSADIPDLSSRGLQCANDTGFEFGEVTYGAWATDGYSKGQSLALGLGLGLPLIAIVAVLGYLLWRSRRTVKRYENSGLALGFNPGKA